MPLFEDAGPLSSSIDAMRPELEERAALVALLRLPGARWPEIVLDVLDEGSAVAVLRRRMKLDDALFSADRGVDEAIEAAERLLAEWSGEGIGVHAFFDDGYPPQLRDIHQSPPLLFTRGDPRPDVRAIAVVGTRQASEHGLKIATAVAEALTRDGVTVVSGLAKGIDTAAHRAALSVRGRTVAVIGTGIRRAYPSENRSLQERIAREGLVISQFWPDAPPSKQSFPMRNAVMSGYAAATVVVEAPQRSGARIQARLALQHGRPVVMPRELLEHDWARDYAERPGVHVVGNLDDMLAVANDLISDSTAAPGELSGIPGLAWN